MTDKSVPKDYDSVAEAKRVLSVEAEALQAVAAEIGESFRRAVERIISCRGRVIVTGMGKSGLVGKKIAATLCSTGTPSIFLHPAEAAHGDLGIVSKQDIVIAISHGGKTEEILNLLPHFKRIGIPIIAFTGDTKSPLAKLSDEVLSVNTPREACPWDLVPTSSTTATMALGDALAVALLNRHGFKRDDFGLIHPGGNLGRKLLYRVADLMHSGKENPTVRQDLPLGEAVKEMTAGKLGMVGVVDDQERYVGVFTDGDLRRTIQRHGGVEGLTVGEVMTHNPRTISATTLAAEALRVMETNKITSLLIPDEKGRSLGAIHLHDILRAGIV